MLSPSRVIVIKPSSNSNSNSAAVATTAMMVLRPFFLGKPQLPHDDGSLLLDMIYAFDTKMSLWLLAVVGCTYDGAGCTYNALLPRLRREERFNRTHSKFRAPPVDKREIDEDK